MHWRASLSVQIFFSSFRYHTNDSNLKDRSLPSPASSLSKWINPEKPRFPQKPVVSMHLDWVIILGLGSQADEVTKSAYPIPK